MNSPVGEFILAATNDHILMVEYSSEARIQKHLSLFEKHYSIRNKRCPLHKKLEHQILGYFSGELKNFNLPLRYTGTSFQQEVWQELQNIPFGKTITYQEQAFLMNQPKAIRAIAAANGGNKLAIIIPCHRVIGSNGSLTGYSGGMNVKEFLLHFEQGSKQTVLF